MYEVNPSTQDVGHLRGHEGLSAGPVLDFFRDVSRALT